MLGRATIFGAEVVEEEEDFGADGLGGLGVADADMGEAGARKSNCRLHRAR
jgi:hypothetical protein